MDWVCNVIQSHNQLPLTKLICVLNDRYSGISPVARLQQLNPFRLKEDDIQAGISGDIRRLRAPFLWYDTMGVISWPLDEYNVLQCALTFDVINHFLCSTNLVNEQ